jgi:hypothetical protein
MKKFETIREAFDWWINEIYPALPAEIKKGRLTYAWRDYKHNGSISETRMRDILVEFGEFDIVTTIVYNPKR